MVFTKNFSSLSGSSGPKIEAQGTCSKDRVRWVVMRPHDIQELQQILAIAQKTDSKVFRLSRLCSQEAILQKIDRIENLTFESTILVDMSAFNKIVEHVKDDQVISIETGTTLQALTEYLKKKNQWFPASSIFKEDSVLDFIDQASGGHHVLNYGGARGLVLGLSVALSNGTLIKTGGKVVKNVTGYDLSKIFVGGQGTFGLAYQVNLRLFTQLQKQKLHVFACDDLRQSLLLADALERLAQRAAGQASVQIIDARLLMAAMPNWGHLKKENAPAEESIFRLKSTFNKGAKSESCLVFFHALGQRDVVAQVIKEAQVIATDVPVWEFEDGSASYLSDFACQAADLLTMSAGSAQMTVSSSRRVIDRLMTDSFCNSEMYWYCQRLAGKLVIAHERANLDDWIFRVRQSGESCAISYATPQYFYALDKREASDSTDDSLKVRQDLIDGLKAKLDPSAMLNPLHIFQSDNTGNLKQ